MGGREAPFTLHSESENTCSSHFQVCPLLFLDLRRSVKKTTDLRSVYVGIRKITDGSLSKQKTPVFKYPSCEQTNLHSDAALLSCFYTTVVYVTTLAPNL